MSRPLKKFARGPMSTFLMGEVTKFTLNWKSNKDMGKLGIVISNDEFIVPLGNPHLFAAICQMAVNPKGINSDEQQAFFTGYVASPDYVLKLLLHLRNRLSKASPHRKQILFGRGLVGPKEAGSDAAKEDSRRLRQAAAEDVRKEELYNQQVRREVAQVEAEIREEQRAKNKSQKGG